MANAVIAGGAGFVGMLLFGVPALVIAILLLALLVVAWAGGYF